MFLIVKKCKWLTDLNNHSLDKIKTLETTYYFKISKLLWCIAGEIVFEFRNLTLPKAFFLLQKKKKKKGKEGVTFCENGAVSSCFGTFSPLQIRSNDRWSIRIENWKMYHGSETKEKPKTKEKYSRLSGLKF